MNSDRAAANDVDVDLGRLFGSLRRHWLGMLLFALVSAGLVFLLAAAATPKYRAETRILIEQRETVFTRPQGEEAVAPAALDAEAIASQAEIMASAPILTKVAKEFDLASRDEFDTSDPSFVDRFLTIIGMKADPIVVTPEEAVLASFREKLEIYRVENARVIVISFSSEDPRLAAAIPNAIADAYLENQREARQQSNADATDWLEPEIADLRERVQEAEERVARFRARIRSPDRSEQHGARHPAAFRDFQRIVARTSSPCRSRGRCRSSPPRAERWRLARHPARGAGVGSGRAPA